MDFKDKTQDPSTPVSRAGESAREPSSAQDDMGMGGISVVLDSSGSIGF